MENLFKLPKIFINLNCIDWEQIYNNLNCDNLETVINKQYYSDKYNYFNKTFGIKVKNVYDLSLTPINLIPDSELVMDEFGFCFSYYDLRKISESSLHPYNKQLILNQVMVYHQPITIIEYYQSNMLHLPKIPSLEMLNQSNDLSIQFEQLINNEFFTNNLLSIYNEKLEHLDYTVGLLCYVLSIIEDYHFRYIIQLKSNYCQESDKYYGFLHLFIEFLTNVKNENNYESYHYVCIIIFKILQYRYNLITESEDLFNMIKSHFDNKYSDELYWSIILDRPNFICQKRTGNISLININIDNIFSNCEYIEYFYTLLIYLHNIYMKQPSYIDGQLVSILNYYKTAENYSYLDVVRYFTNLYHQIEQNNQTSELNNYIHLIFRYYLKPMPIHINPRGEISD